MDMDCEKTCFAVSGANMSPLVRRQNSFRAIATRTVATTVSKTKASLYKRNLPAKAGDTCLPRETRTRMGGVGSSRKVFARAPHLAVVTKARQKVFTGRHCLPVRCRNNCSILRWILSLSPSRADGCGPRWALWADCAAKLYVNRWLADYLGFRRIAVKSPGNNE